MKINDIIEKELKEYEFVEYTPSRLDPSSVDRCFQHCFKDDQGNKKYFLDVKHYECIHPANYSKLEGYEVSCQLYFKDGHKAFNVDFLEGISITEAKEFVDFLFESGKLDNYEDR